MVYLIYKKDRLWRQKTGSNSRSKFRGFGSRKKIALSPLERLKSIERSMTYTQNNSLAVLTKNIEILNSPLDKDRKRDIAILDITETSDNEKKMTDILEILFDINVNNMDILKNNVIDIIKFLNKSVN